MNIKENILEFYGLLDEVIKNKVSNLSFLVCSKGCSECCVDDLTVFEIESTNIIEHNHELLSNGIPHSEGKCAFLGNEGECRIYEQRPYVCRTQGLPLRWLEEDENDNLIEYRDICPLNENEEFMKSEDTSNFFTLGSWEEKLATMQHKYGNGEMKRKSLRALFTNK